MHYQRQRREGFADAKHAGRPREYEPDQADPYGGAPKMSVRFEPDVMQWVKEQGGARWLRFATRELKRLSGVPEFEEWWHQLATPAGSEGGDAQ